MIRRRVSRSARCAFAAVTSFVVACAPTPSLGPLPDRLAPRDLDVLLVTLDTTRADRIGALGGAERAHHVERDAEPFEPVSDRLLCCWEVALLAQARGAQQRLDELMHHAENDVVAQRHARGSAPHRCARRAVATSMRAAAFRDHVLASLWFVPVCFVIAAIVLSRVSVVIDHSVHLDRRPGVNLPSDAATMTVVASTIAAAMLTFLGVVFTTTLVAVQLASSQYSPRIVRLSSSATGTVSAGPTTS